MASPGLLILLLMASELLICPASPSLTKEEVKDLITTTIKYVDLAGQAVEPILKILDKSYPGVVASLGLLHLLITGTPKDDPVLKEVVEQFHNLNLKLDKYHMEQKWGVWASGAYFKPEMDIMLAWSDFKTLVESLGQSPDEATKKRHLEEFLSSYQRYEPATKVLHKLLTAEEPTFINKLGLMLAEHVNCHDDDIRRYSALIETLILKGSWLNTVYYHYKNITSKAREDESAKIRYDAATAMFQVQKYCITQITDYVRKDVEDLIEKSKEHGKLADEIREYLEKNYKDYEWMVVAFTTKKSDHSILKIRNKHSLTGFTVVQKDGVSVAVARQRAGDHTMAQKIKDAIEKCMGNDKVLCYKVGKALSKCTQTVDNIPLSQLFTAVHAFHGGAHASSSNVNYKDAKPDTTGERFFKISKKTEATKTYVYEGTCILFALIAGPPFKGHFHVMLKSDEEIQKNPCSKLECGNEMQGQCDSVGTPPVAVCVCNHPYFGRNCENNPYKMVSRM